jgi:hypothetical protein
MGNAMSLDITLACTIVHRLAPETTKYLAEKVNGAAIYDLQVVKALTLKPAGGNKSVDLFE